MQRARSGQDGPGGAREGACRSVPLRASVLTWGPKACLYTSFAFVLSREVFRAGLGRVMAKPKGKGSGKGMPEGSTEEHPTPSKGSGKQSKIKGELMGGKSARPGEHPNPKGSGKGSTKSAGPKDGHPTPKASGSTKSAGPEEHTPKGSGKQHQEAQREEKRNLNPASMKRFFSSETYSSARSSAEGELARNKGSGSSTGHGHLKGSGKTAGAEEQPNNKQRAGARCSGLRSASPNT